MWLILSPMRYAQVLVYSIVGYTCLDYANEVDEILKLAKWLQFKELEQALAAAVAVNYYTGLDER